MNKLIIEDNFLSHEELVHLRDNVFHEFPWRFVKDNDKESSFSLGYSKNLHQHPINSSERFILDKIYNFCNTSKEIDRPFRVRTLYYNALRPLDRLHYHVDGDGPTFLVYTNVNWKWWWGSGTKIKGKGYVKAKPGRMVVFPGECYHKGISPNILARSCPRYSIAVQTTYI